MFFYAFGLFKTAVIAQQIYFRYAQGLTKDARLSAAFIFAQVRALADQAELAIARGAIQIATGGRRAHVPSAG